MEKVKALIDLSKLSFARYDQRRKYHWQISIAFWALIVGAIIKKKELTLPMSNDKLFLIVAGLIYIFVWLRSVWVAQENDKRLGNYYRAEASSMLQNKEHDMSDPPAKITYKSFKDWRDFLIDYGTLQHICVTVFLFFVLYYLDICQP